MRISIDAAGRIVVPKALRDELGVSAPAELEIMARDGVIEIVVPDVQARVEDSPAGPTIVTDAAMEPLTVADVRAAIDRVRR